MLIQNLQTQFKYQIVDYNPIGVSNIEIKKLSSSKIDKITDSINSIQYKYDITTFIV
jgi:hypothetical protein